MLQLTVHFRRGGGSLCLCLDDVTTPVVCCRLATHKMAEVEEGGQPAEQQQQQSTDTADGYDYKRLHNYPLIKVR